MRGLLTKDLYMILRYTRAFLVMILIFFATSLLTEVKGFLIMYPMIFICIIPITVLSYDEHFHWNLYALTMPISRKTIVNEKYILSVIIISSGLLLASACFYIDYLKGNMEWGFMVVSIKLLLISSSIIPIIEFPLIFKFGSQKARLAYIAIIGILAGVSVTMFDNMRKSATLLKQGNSSFIVVIAVLVVLFLVSWKLSIRFFENKDM